MKKILPLLVLILCLNCETDTHHAPPVSGYYGNHVVLAYNESSKEISGIYQTNINANKTVVDSCYFYFVGKFSGEKTNIISWRIGHRLDEIFGILTVQDSLSFDLSFEKNHLHCTANQGKKGIYKLDRRTDWRYIRTVKAATASLYPTSNVRSPFDTILTKGDIMYITNKKINSVETTSGWMREEDLIRFPG